MFPLQPSGPRQIRRCGLPFNLEDSIWTADSEGTHSNTLHFYPGRQFSTLLCPELLPKLAGGAYVPELFVGMYAPLGMGRSQPCRATARLRHLGLKGLAQIRQSQWRVCNFPKGLSMSPGRLVTTLGEMCLRQTADPTNQGSAPAGQGEFVIYPRRATGSRKPSDTSDLEG